MEPREQKIQIFTPFERSLHLFALALSLLLFPSGLAARGSHGIAALVHGVAAYGLLLVFGAHLAKFVTGWLEKGSKFELLARPADFSDALNGALAGFGLARPPKRTNRGYRQRIPYTLFALLLPLGVVTGAAYSHPAGFISFLGGTGVYLAAKLHLLLGATFLGGLIFHLYFSFLCPEALWWNSSFLTGFQTRERFLRMNPDSQEGFAVEEAENPVEEEKGPGVEELLSEGNREAKAGNYAGAAAAFRSALEIYPGYPQALFNLGACLYRLGEVAEASEVLNSYLMQDEFGEAADRARVILKEISEREGNR